MPPVRSADGWNFSQAFLPENCAFIGTSHDQSQSIAAPVDGALVMPFRNLAKETGMWLSLGGVQETSTELGKVHNTSVIIDSDGNIRAHYRKVRGKYASFQSDWSRACLSENSVNAQPPGSFV
jgi:peroxiredoxin